MNKLIINFCNLKYVNKLIYNFTRSKFSRHFIPAFIRHYKIDMSEYKTEKYNTLQDFFIRNIDLNFRPIGNGEFISPCDGVISAAGKINSDTAFEVKGKVINTKILTGDDEEYKYFQVIYLSPKNYHRFHAINDGEFFSERIIGGKSIPVNDTGFKMGNPFFKNKRVVLKSKDYAYIAVGATNVNTITINKKSFKKGDEIGYFSFGSTIIILYKNITLESKLGEIKVRENLFNL